MGLLSVCIVQGQGARGQPCGVPPVRVSPDDGVALQIGYNTLLRVGCNGFQNLQDLLPIVTLTEQRNSKRLSHDQKELE